MDVFPNGNGRPFGVVGRVVSRNEPAQCCCFDMAVECGEVPASVSARNAVSASLSACVGPLHTVGSLTVKPQRIEASISAGRDRSFPRNRPCRWKPRGRAKLRPRVHARSPCERGLKESSPGAVVVDEKGLALPVEAFPPGRTTAARRDRDQLRGSFEGLGAGQLILRIWWT